MGVGGKVCAWGIALALALASPWAAARAPSRIVYLEPARAMQAKRLTQGSREELAFEAFGKRFDLHLEPNPQLAAAVPAGRADLVALEGRIAGLPGSWARLTRTRRGLSGLVSDGREIFAIEPASEVAALADAALKAPAAGTVVYRLADALVDPEAVSCGVADQGKPTTALALYKSLGAELAPLAASVADRQIDVAMVADHELYQAYGDATIDFLLARMNAVDGLFAAQVGLRVHVGSAFIYTTDQDPFTVTAAPELLQQLAGYRRTTIASQRLGLTHLMTGRELDDTTVGIAYLDAVCGLQSASLTEARSGKLSAALISLVAAHEIGHNFGAPHDGEAGKACAATNPNAFLMAPTLSTANSQFSQCSRDEIARRIAAAQCLTAVDQVDVEIIAPVATARHGVGVNYSLTFNVRSLGTRDALSTLARFAVPAGSTLEAANAAGGSCTVSGSQASCSLGTLPSGAARTITLSLTGNAIGTETLTADVMAIDDGAVANDTASVEIVTAPLADLATTAAVSPASLVAGGDAQFAVAMTNKGPSVTSDARLSIDIPAGITVSGIDAGGLACAVSANSISCDPQLVADGDARTVRFTVRTSTAGNFTVTAVALTAAIDPESANNSASATLAVTAAGGGPTTPPPPPPPPTSGASSGGGGGGSFPVALLLFLALAHAARAAQPMTTSRSLASTARPGRTSTSAT